MIDNTFEEIYKVVAKIPKGKVSTYGDISNFLKLNNPRVVGYALHVNSEPDNVPCHRVVNRNGEVAPGYAFGGLKIQKKLLIKEGVGFKDNKVELKKHRFKIS